MQQVILFQNVSSKRNINSEFDGDYYTKDVIVCPWCYGMTPYVYGELTLCDICNTEINDGDLYYENE